MQETFAFSASFSCSSDTSGLRSRGRLRAILCGMKSNVPQSCFYPAPARSLGFPDFTFHFKGKIPKSNFVRSVAILVILAVFSVVAPYLPYPNGALFGVEVV